MTVLRERIGEVLRSRRMRQGRTLREVSSQARVSLGYISEVERGQKEASSELLAAICAALQVPLSDVLREVSDTLSVIEPAPAPVALPTPVALPAVAAPSHDDLADDVPVLEPVGAASAVAGARHAVRAVGRDVVAAA